MVFFKFFCFFGNFNNYMGLLFFRDPERFSIENNKYLVSPADGLITQVSECSGPVELNLENKKFTKVSIFMNVLIVT